MSHKIISVNTKKPDASGTINVGLSDLTSNSASGSLQYDSNTWKSAPVSSGGLNYSTSGTPTYLDRTGNDYQTHNFDAGNQAQFGHSYRPNGYSAYVWGSDATGSGQGDLFDGVGMENNLTRDTVSFDMVGFGAPWMFYCGHRFQHGKAYIISIQMSVFEGSSTPSQFIARFFNVTQNSYFGPRLLMDNRGSVLTAVLDLRLASAPETVRIQVESGNGSWEVEFSHKSSQFSEAGFNAHSEQFYSFT
jgi:hypothetical protein